MCEGALEIALGIQTITVHDNARLEMHNTVFQDYMDEVLVYPALAVYDNAEIYV